MCDSMEISVFIDDHLYLINRVFENSPNFEIARQLQKHVLSMPSNKKTGNYHKENRWEKCKKNCR